MKELSLNEIKAIELEILKEIHQICEKENIRYSLCGGTLLGAVRHGGFIPWDDDIDIIMPRKDYETFIDYCKSNSVNFDLLCIETNKNYSYLFAKATNKNTIIREKNANSNKIDMGVYVDIFPLDGMGDTIDLARKNFIKTSFERELLVARNWKRFFKSKTHSSIYEPVRFVFFVLSRFVNSETIINSLQRKFKKNDFDNSKFSGCFMGSYRLKEVLKTDIYKVFSEIEFEGYKFKCFNHYDEYLTSIYGDYMKLPPKEKQVSHHTYKAYKKQ